MSSASWISYACPHIPLPWSDWKLKQKNVLWQKALIRQWASRKLCELSPNWGCHAVLCSICQQLLLMSSVHSACVCVGGERGGLPGWHLVHCSVLNSLYLAYDLFLLDCNRKKDSHNACVYCNISHKPQYFPVSGTKMQQHRITIVTLFAIKQA